MKITRISIDGFGLFEGKFDLELPGDIALVVGDNETGKSTIFKAIHAILFGLENESEKKAVAPHGSSAPRSGSLEIEAAEGLHRIRRDFASNHTRVELLGPQGRVLFDGSAKPAGRTDEKEAYDGVIRGLVGIDSRDVFINSVMAGQGGLRPEMGAVVRRIVSGSTSADYTVAIENLKDVCDDLSMQLPWRRRSARKPRRIEVLTAEIEKSRRDISEARESFRTIEECRESFDALESEAAEIDKRRAEGKAWREDLAAFSQALKEERVVDERVSEDRGRLVKIERLSEDLGQFVKRIESEYSDCAALPETAEADLAELSGLAESRKELEKRHREAKAEAETPGGFPGKIGCREMLLEEAAIVLIITGLVLEGLMRVAVIGVGAAILIRSAYRLIFGERDRVSSLKGRRDEIGRQLESLKAQEASIRARYPALEERHPEDMIKRLREYKELLQEKALKQEALKHHPEKSEAQERYDASANEMIVVSKRIAELKAKRPTLEDVERRGSTGAALEKTDSEISSLEKRRADLVREKEDLIRRLASAEAGEGVAEEALAERIEEMQVELEAMKTSLDAHVIAVQTLDEAAAEFRSAHHSRIEKKTADLLERITGVPCGVKLDEELDALGLERDGVFLEPGQMSQGLRDQLHFALRLAAVEEISTDAGLPILLDDPFVNFDGKRLKAVFETLEKLSESRQVLIFTHDREYCKWRKPARLLES